VQSRTARALIAVAALVAVVVLFVVLAGGDDESSNDATTATTRTETATETQTNTTRTVTVPPVERIVVEGGEPRGGVKRLSVDSGERVRFSVTSDVADEVHVHGYDISRDVPAGGSVRFGFPASIEGVFEVELEGRGVQIAELRVSP
jgi:ABC-type Fe3+-hydroxamate transport system substrate-binding protein